VSAAIFALDYLSRLLAFLLDLSRLAEDFVIFCFAGVSYLILPDEFSIGQHLMPQKKNPVAGN